MKSKMNDDYRKLPFLPGDFLDLLNDPFEHIKAVEMFDSYFANEININDLLLTYSKYFNKEELELCLDKMAGIDQMT